MNRRYFFHTLAASLATAPAWAQFDASPWRGPLSALQLPDLQGKTWRAPDLQGGAVLLNFWASWCEPCRSEMPSLQTLAEFHGPDKLLVLAINFKEPAQRAQRFVQGAGLRLPVLLDEQGQLARQWDVKVFPTTFLVDRRGQPRQRIRGELDWTSPQADKLVSALLA